MSRFLVHLLKPARGRHAQCHDSEHCECECDNCMRVWREEGLHGEPKGGREVEITITLKVTPLDGQLMTDTEAVAAAEWPVVVFPGDGDGDETHIEETAVLEDGRRFRVEIDEFICDE